MASLRVHLGPWKTSVLASAENNRKHRFPFFALKDADFGAIINWHKDYKSGRISPRQVFSKSINYYRKAEVCGDIKYIWEINRWHHLISLGEAAWILEGKGNSAKFRDQIVLEIDSWAQANPFMRGVNWASSIESAIRLLVLFFVWELLQSVNLLGDEVKRRWLKLIELHCLFISRNFSRYSSANNHLIAYLYHFITSD